MGDWGGDHNRTGQCRSVPLLSPVIGSLKLVSGDGTRVGTVIKLQCPSRHRAVSGSHISCVWSSNDMQWTGGTPECIPLTRFEDEGFRLAFLISFISVVFILFMSIIFITSCLVSYVRRDERRKMERARKREEAKFWHQIDIEGLEQQREGLHNHKTRNNNNNNSNNSTEERDDTQEQQQTTKHLPTVTCRCHQ
ncbi:sushi domain-containing protein 3-like [Xyrauchen texanus]|uniref:sushi domain-containing protein 3-like n=1 Tax=Xyrauchen texanus TaxID=154827 RepID=UPI0022419E79|nr:sushi domain-containing protein 3-like [Xyrauchen texanus]